MNDDRIALINGQSLIFDSSTQYIIMEELERRKTYIVYKAYYIDTIEEKHIVIIEEYYPCYINIKREHNGALNIAPNMKNLYRDGLKNFNDMYRKNNSFSNKTELHNSILEAKNIFYFHNTLYIIINYADGQNYCLNCDENIKSVFIRLLTLSKIIKKYHDFGALYLDINPKNILISPESKEYMILLYSDILLYKEEIQSNIIPSNMDFNIYRAPELLQRDKNKICEATDIYSIGVIAFYKIFARTNDFYIDYHYDFNSMNYFDKRYQPDFFSALHEFLQKTLCVSVGDRYQNMDEIIKALENLIAISDVEDVYLIDNFKSSYHCQNFVGRQKELNEIAEIFNAGERILFLSGIGGIGKTEIAKRYANENKEKYRKIIFISFKNSIMETICGNELYINTIEQTLQESDEAYFNRKLDVFKTVISLQDLIILDNFDIEKDENLQSLLKCHCNFLVTSRQYFTDYKQITIKEMEKEEDIFKLFSIYNTYPYQEFEKKQIKNIITIVEHHTMTVEMIAKYLRETKESPEKLLNHFMEKEGIMNVNEIAVKQKKDRKLYSKSVQKHLQILFDLSQFSERECELLRSFSLLGYIRISKRKFLEYFPYNNETALQKLIHNGWIEYYEQTDKIALHQIILDLVYYTMHPNTQNCSNMVNKISEYMNQNIETSTERKIRNKLISIFMERLNEETSLTYAKLCVNYCQNIKKTKKYIDIAEKIFLHHANQNKECYDFLQMLCRIKIKMIAPGDDLFELKEDMDEEFSFESFTNNILKDINLLAHKAVEYANLFCQNNVYLGKFYVTIANEIDFELTDSLLIMVVDEENKSIKKVFDFVVQLFDKSEHYLLQADISNKEKERLLKEIQKFYLDDDYSAMYRCKHYANAQKAFYYQQIIDTLREKTKNRVIYADDVGYHNMAEEAEDKKEYKKAIELYDTAYENGEILYDYAYKRIADIYVEMGEIDSAIIQLKELLDIDKQYQDYTNHACYDLILLLFSQKKEKEAQYYAKELINYNESCVNDKENKYHITYLILANYQLYKMEYCEIQKKEYWKNCLIYLDKLPKDEKFTGDMIPFLIDLADHESTKECKIKKAFEYMEKTDIFFSAEKTGLYLDYIINICNNEREYVNYHIIALLHYCKVLLDVAEYDKAIEYCIKANHIYEQNNLKNEYLYSSIHNNMGECYSNMTDEQDNGNLERKKCNYYILAEHDIVGKKAAEQIEIWRDATSKYHYIEDYIMEEKCFDRLFEILTPILNQYEYSSFENYSQMKKEQIYCYQELKKNKEIKEACIDTYFKALEYYTEICTEELEYKARNFKWHLDDYADFLFDMEEKEGIILYIISIIVCINMQQQKEIYYDIENYALGKRNNLLCVLEKVIHGSISNDNIDDVIYIYNKLKPIFQKDTQWNDFQVKLEWFSKKYQYQDIEFKR